MKPAYLSTIPSVDDVRAVKPNGFNLVSTFSGCGGSCLGFRMAGFKVLWANEFVEAARDTYLANFPDTPMDSRDIREVHGDDIREVIGDVDVDVLEGSPPCAAFSTASGVNQAIKRWGETKKYSDTKQRVDDLFLEFIRIVGELRPKVFVAENVAALAAGINRGKYLSFLGAMRELDYEVQARVIDAALLGVPQMRKRLIFVGVRKDVGSPRFPRPDPHGYTLREACPWVRAIVNRDQDHEGYVSPDRPVRTVTTANGKGSWFSHQEIWAPMGVFDEESWEKSDGSESTEVRVYSIPELRRIASFPDDFVLTGDAKRQWERVARAVPPKMMRRIAEVVRDEILEVAV